MKLYDVIIIGAGPAGLTAAIYAARKKLKTLVLSKDIGGQTLWAANVENYIGFRLISGMELVKKFEEHVRDYGVELETMSDVKGIKKKDRFFEVYTKDAGYNGKTLIIASGKTPRKLNVPGEDKFIGRGLAYCATCDAPLFSGKNVAVVGGGNSALEAALQLSEIVKKVYLINNTAGLGGDEVTRDKVKSKNNVEILNNTQALEITGEKFVSGIKIKTPVQEKTLDVEGVFVGIGSVPSSDFAKSLLELNETSEIRVNCASQTNVPGIFAAGDVTSIPAKQIIAAAGEGCKAALAAYGYLIKMK